MSPRKSSTSSGSLFPRPRYLGVEVVGDVPLTPRGLELVLAERLRTPDDPSPKVRVIRLEQNRALVEVANSVVARAREKWNGETQVGGQRIALHTRATWGTLVKGKAWIRRGV